MHGRFECRSEGDWVQRESNQRGNKGEQKAWLGEPSTDAREVGRKRRGKICERRDEPRLRKIEYRTGYLKKRKETENGDLNLNSN